MRPKLVLYICIVLAIIGFIWGRVDRAKAPSSKNTNTSTTSKSEQTTGFNKKQYSLTSPASIWVVVNKQHPLQPADYVPSDLTMPNVTLADPGADNMQMRAVTATALAQLFADAKQQSINLEVVSAYRSYGYQQSLYSRYVATSGQSMADAESARAGYSEHQTGLSVDIGGANGVCALSQCFGSTPEGEWLAANAYKYGFILRYPQGLTNITGYEYEPWHFRYIGTTLSQEMYKANIQTMEQFFGVSGGTVYKQ